MVAPFAKGQPLATLRVTSGEQPVADIPLVALEAVEQSGAIGRTWDAVRMWIR
jgi:D-alanyl-D-alanine carboxypeptidase (penicillin-binding protein 5/6)